MTRRPPIAWRFRIWLARRLASTMSWLDPLTTVVIVRGYAESISISLPAIHPSIGAAATVLKYGPLPVFVETPPNIVFDATVH